jgi:hypothetical protein
MTSLRPCGSIHVTGNKSPACKLRAPRGNQHEERRSRVSTRTGGKGGEGREGEGRISFKQSEAREYMSMWEMMNRKYDGEYAYSGMLRASMVRK